MNVIKADEGLCVTMGVVEGHREGVARTDGTDVSAGRPVLVHHVVARVGERGLEVLRVYVEGRGEVLPVFSAGWAARGYMFAEARGGGWHARACGADDMMSVLAGPGAGVGWVALDPRPGYRGRIEAANMMPRENFVDYLSFSRDLSLR